MEGDDCELDVGWGRGWGVGWVVVERVVAVVVVVVVAIAVVIVGDLMVVGDRESALYGWEGDE